MNRPEEDSPKKEAEKQPKKAMLEELVLAMRSVAKWVDSEQKRNSERETQDAAANTQNLAAKLYRLWDKHALPVFTAVLAFCAILQWHTFEAQRSIMADQLSQMRGQLTQMTSGSAQTERIIAEAHRISDKMGETLKQSKAALDASITASRNEQRAWIVTGNMQHGPFDPDRPFAWSFILHNEGKTPAHNVHIFSEIFVGPKNLNIDNYLRDKGAAAYKERISVYGVVPNAIHLIPGSRSPNISLDQWADVRSGKLEVYFVGEIVYNLFYEKDTDPPHVTQFAEHWLPPPVDMTADCTTHNKID